MSVEKAGYFCLTTLEYTFQGTSSLTTHCPSCGLRMIIRYDNLVNRATSLGLIIGISALIGYHFGANRDLIRKLSGKFLRFFDFNESEPNVPNFNIRQVLRRYNYPRKLSDNTSDSAVDFHYPDNENFDEQFYVMMNYDKYYDDLFCSGHNPNNRTVHSKTVDKIDQVLHQIDDIKKSIVEIDDELYHVSGSECASFNPDFLTLADYEMEEFDENQFSPSPRKLSNNHKHLCTPKQTLKCQTNRAELLDPLSDQRIHEDQRKLSRLSFGSADNLQLEWDESECDFYFQYPCNESNVAQKKKENNSQIEKLSTSSMAVSNNVKTSMTDEQKLKNMHELLEEAKRLGLLNNIIDAFLDNSTTTTKTSIQKISSNDYEEE